MKDPTERETGVKGGGDGRSLGSLTSLIHLVHFRLRTVGEGKEVGSEGHGPSRYVLFPSFLSLRSLHSVHDA